MPDSQLTPGAVAYTDLAIICAPRIFPLAPRVARQGRHARQIRPEPEKNRNCPCRFLLAATPAQGSPRMPLFGLSARAMPAVASRLSPLQLVPCSIRTIRPFLVPTVPLHSAWSAAEDS